ncbi:MAG TPA: response regulator transcription factor [Acidimicrobiales bacterium]|nr:response regulator transcription factor [Acidimicrobiales bacterium]
MPPARILVVEDEDNVAFVVGEALRLAGFAVLTARWGREGLQLALDADVALMVLDVSLGDTDGFELCRRLRAAGSELPVVFLTARDATQDRIRGLTIGGDDYLTKPFSVEELVARVRVVLRRAGKLPGGQVLRCGDVALDDLAHRVTSGGAQVDLSPTEYKLLRFLLQNKGRVLTRGQILDHVWDYDFEGEPTVVETFVSTLRKKVDSRERRLIQTVRGIGYRLAER